MWGFFPLYWKLLDGLSWQILTTHRILWAFTSLFILSWMAPELRTVFRKLRDRRIVAVYALAAGLILINWAAFLYAVDSKQVLQASLGYYINPLLNVLLGVIVLGEKMRPLQWAAIAIAGIGVCVMGASGEGVPWLALTMATAFAFYALIKKTAPLPALQSLLVETLFLLPFAIAYFAFDWVQTDGSQYTVSDWVFLSLGGIVTISPLAFFAMAAKRLPLSLMGILQYLGPTLQFFVSVVILSEPFGPNRLYGFLFIWAALTIFAISSLRARSPKSFSRDTARNA